jgi:hypothetical protein
MRRPDHSVSATVELRQQERRYTNHVLKMDKIQTFDLWGDLSSGPSILPVSEHFHFSNNDRRTQRIAPLERANFLSTFMENPPGECPSRFFIPQRRSPRKTARVGRNDIWSVAMQDESGSVVWI